MGVPSRPTIVMEPAEGRHLDSEPGPDRFAGPIPARVEPGVTRAQTGRARGWASRRTGSAPSRYWRTVTREIAELLRDRPSEAAVGGGVLLLRVLGARQEQQREAGIKRSRQLLSQK